jgi:hypothetical protein
MKFFNQHRAAFVSTAVAIGVDCTIQRRSRRKYDVKRTLRVGSYAFWSTYPQLSYFKWLGSTFKGYNAITVCQKTMTNQFLFAPINITLAIWWDLMLQNKTKSEVFAKVSKNMGPALIEGSIFWVPVNMVGFYSVSNRNQFIFFKIASVLYKFILIPRTNAVE